MSTPSTVTKLVIGASGGISGLAARSRSEFWLINQLATIILNSFLISSFVVTLFCYHYSPRGATLPVNFSAPQFPAWSRPTPPGAAVRRDIAMSLTSRVAGLFSPTPPSDTSATPSDESSASKWAHPGLNEISHARDSAMALVEEEEPRPPYLHV